MLSNGEPFLVYTRVHDTASNMGESTQTASIVLEWADLVQKFNQPTVICTMWGDKFLKDSDVRYIAALKPDRFRILTNLLKQQVNNTGDSSWAWNEARGEAAVYHKSRDKSTVENCPIALLRHPTKCVGMMCQFMMSTRRCSRVRHIQPPGASSTIALFPTPFRGTLIRPWRRIFGIICSVRC